MDSRCAGTLVHYYGYSLRFSVLGLDRVAEVLGPILGGSDERRRREIISNGGCVAVAGDLYRSQYLLLSTFRRDGSIVSSPVWAAADSGRLFVWTETDSFKVKRIRRNPEVMVQPCTHGGSPRGVAVRGRAEFLDDAGTAQVRKLLARKYGALGWLAVRWPWPLNFGLSKRFFQDILTNRRTAKVGLAITVDHATTFDPG